MQHRECRIYQVSLELVALCREVMESLPTGYGFLADQLRRACASVTLNFSEGSGKSTPRDRRRYFHIARGSVYEVGAVLDVGLTLGVVSESAQKRGIAFCDHLGGMLSKYR